jgi:hypothetical protein
MIATCERVTPKVAWADQIPDEQWAVYETVIDAAAGRGVRVMLGGAFALAVHTGHWRNTKDLDLFILPEQRKEAIGTLSDLGLQDYYDQLPYERHWIYRGIVGDIIVDLIWQMANDRAEVERSWLSHATKVEIRGKEVAVLAAEELVWMKIYVMQRDRCDWTDLLNILYARGSRLDWKRLLSRLGSDAPLLTALVTVFRWTCPGRAQQFPPWIWDRLELEPPSMRPMQPVDPNRVNLLDTRDWFGPLLLPHEQLQV